jgi:hypothetical protein
MAENLGRSYGASFIQQAFFVVHILNNILTQPFFNTGIIGCMETGFPNMTPTFISIEHKRQPCCQP